MRVKNKIVSTFVLPVIITLGLSSCMKDLQDDVKMETIPIPEGIKVGSVELGPQYFFNAYYDLENNQVVKVGTNFVYDLAFECSPVGWHILLNSGRFMHAGNSKNKDFEAVTSTTGINMQFDPSDGDLDSTAVGRWFQTDGSDTLFPKNVYVIDLGVDETGNPLGYKKVVFQNLSNGIYTLRHANLDGTEEFTTQIPKNPLVNFTGFSFNNGGQIVDFQPPKDQWDLFFGQYTTLLYAENEPYPYLVRGVLANRSGVEATLYEGEKTFAAFEYDDALGVNFTQALDGIGHEWKYYNLEEGFYAVETENVYVIRDAAGNFYKMHFLSYFNSEGENGYPQFEFMKLVP